MEVLQLISWCYPWSMVNSARRLCRLQEEGIYRNSAHQLKRFQTESIGGLARESRKLLQVVLHCRHCTNLKEKNRERRKGQLSGFLSFVECQRLMAPSWQQAAVLKYSLASDKDSGDICEHRWISGKWLWDETYVTDKWRTRKEITNFRLRLRRWY